MQPFDRDKFDRRFDEIIRPTVERCGFFPYRVDDDDSVTIPIESIEQSIRSSEFCIAEITTNNPNVWYELGYAMACGKEVILLCSDERMAPYPFDVRHRFIIKYETKSPSDFEHLKTSLENKIRGTVSVPLIDEALTEAEMLMLKLVSRNTNTPFEITARERIIVGSDEGALLALKNLVRKGYIEYIYFVDDENRMNSFYRPTTMAEKVGVLVHV